MHLNFSKIPYQILKKSSKAVIAARDYRLKYIEKPSNLALKSASMVKHVVKGEKRACSTLEAGKNKSVLFVAKTRDFKRFCEKIKEKRWFVMNPRFGLSVRSGATK